MAAGSLILGQFASASKGESRWPISKILPALTRPGGTIVFSLSQIAHDEYGFGDRIDALDTAGACQLLDRSRLFRTCPFSAQEAHLRHRVLAYRKA